MGGRDDSALLFGRDDSELLFGKSEGLINRPTVGTMPEADVVLPEQEPAPAAAPASTEPNFLVKEAGYLSASARQGWNNIKSAVAGAQMSEFGELIEAFNRRYTPEQIAASPALTKERDERQAHYARYAGEVKQLTEENKKILAEEGRPSTQLMYGINAPEKRGWGQAAKEIATAVIQDPGSIVDLGLASGPTTIASVAAALFTTFVTKSPTAGAVAGGGMSGSIEFGSEYAENREAGMGHDEAWKAAVLKAGVVGALDAVSMRTAGKALDGVMDAFKYGKGATALKITAKETGRQAALGAGGEAGGSLLAGKEVDPTAVILEAVGETVTGPVEALGTRARLRTTAEREADVKRAKADIIARAIQENVDAAQIDQSAVERAALAAMDPNGPSMISPADTRLPPAGTQPPPAAGTPGAQWAAGASDVPGITGILSDSPNVEAPGGLLGTIGKTVMSAPTVDEAIAQAAAVATTGETIPLPDYTPFEGAPGVTATFRTERGSTYALFDDNTTQRNRSGTAHDDPSTGLQPRSGVTVFMTDDQIDAIGVYVQNKDIPTTLVPDPVNKTVSVVVTEDEGGFKKGRVLASTGYSSTPEIGLSPVEVYTNDSPVGDAGSNVHFGTTITEVNPVAPAGIPGEIPGISPEVPGISPEVPGAPVTPLGGTAGGGLINVPAAPAGTGIGPVGELALEEQRAAGWNTDWPFIPADLGNADFRQKIATDPAVSQEEKEQIFQAGKNLGVVPETENVADYQTAAPETATEGAPLDLNTDGIAGEEVPFTRVPGGNEAFQYALGKTEADGTVAVFRRPVGERGRYGGWRWERDAGQLLPAAETPTGGAPAVDTPPAVPSPLSPEGGTTAGTAPPTITPTGGTPTGGTTGGATPTPPTGGTPTGGTTGGATPTPKPPSEPPKAVTVDTPVTGRQAKVRWEAEKPGVEGAEHTTLAGVPHITTPEGVFHYVRDPTDPKKLVLKEGYVSPEAEAAHKAAMRNATKGAQTPIQAAMEAADPVAVAELLYGKKVDDEFLPIIFPEESLIRMSVDPALQTELETALSQFGFRITDRSIPVKADDVASTAPERMSISALFQPGRPDIQDAGAYFQGNRKGKTTAPPAPKDPTDGQISKMLDALRKDALFSIDVGTFGAVMFKEGMVANINDASDYLAAKIRTLKYAAKTMGSRQVIKMAMTEGIDIVPFISAYVDSANTLQAVFDNSADVAALAKALREKYVKDADAYPRDAIYTAEGNQLRRLGKTENLVQLISRLEGLFLANENSSDQTNRIVKKDPEELPQLRNIIRRGMKDHRQGRDVDTQDFITTFGFAPGGVSFGNWVNQSERAAHLNSVYDSFYDMADLSGVNPVMLGLGLKLKLAIGAQGRGGKTAAWYIPGANEINLTKTKGDGTVGHEWHHGLDHNMRLTTRGDKLMEETVFTLRKYYDATRINDILRGVLRDTSAAGVKDRNLPPKQAFFNQLLSGRYDEAGPIYRAISSGTKFSAEAARLDAGASEPYYAKPTELLSRAFEAMLFDASNGGSPYLVGPTRADGYMSKANGYAGEVYPVGKERARLNQVMRSMLDQIDPQTLEVKLYKKETKIIEVEGLGFTVVDQHSLSAYGSDTLVWYKKQEDAQRIKESSEGQDTYLTPRRLQIAAANKVILEIAPRVDAIMEEMGLFKWPEVKNGSLVESMFFHMRQGWWPKNNAELLDYAGKAYIQKPELLGFDPSTSKGRESIQGFTPAKLDDVKRKQAQEDFEAAASLYVGQIITDMRAKGSDNETIYRHIVGLYNSQPVLDAQDTSSVANQAYSTPLPIGFIAGLLARVNNTTTVLEPTAGNGMLSVTANPKLVIAFELEKRRVSNLKLMEFGRVEQGDALKLLDTIRDQETDVVLANPPFDTLPSPVQMPSWDGRTYKISKLEHLISAKALRGMADGGRAVLIIGAHVKPGTITSNDRNFLNWLYGNYNVTDHFEIAGGMYRKEGASFPIRVLVIAGRNQSEAVYPQDAAIDRINTFDELWGRYVQANDNSQKIVVGTGRRQRGAGGANIPAGGLPAGGPLEDGRPSGQDGAGSGVQTGQPGQSGRRGTAAGQAGERGASGGPDATELTDTGDGGVGATGEGGTRQPGGRDAGRAGATDAELGGLSDLDIDDLFGDLEGPAAPKKPRKRGEPAAAGTPESPGPRQPRAPARPKGPVAVPVELQGIEGLDALMVELGNALGLTPTERVPVKKTKVAAGVEGALKPDQTPQERQTDEALDRLARQTKTEENGGNDDPASGLYSRRGNINYADVEPIIQRVWDAVGTKITDLKERIKAVYNYLKASFGDPILAHLRTFVNELRAQVKARPANQTPVQSEEIDTESQVVYHGKSRYNSEGVRLPRSQSRFVYAALENLEAEVGDIDAFVAEELGYASPDEMAKYLMGFQIDALALAIRSNQMNKGFVVGDDTGVGKGRVAAAMLVWAKKHGKIPIFVSQNKTLYTAMYADLKNIGHGDLRIGMTNADSVIVEDIGGGRSRPLAINTPGNRAGARLVAHLSKHGSLPPGIDVVFTTYTQLGGSGSANRQDAISALVASSKAAMVMDEAHNAAGDSATNTFFMSLLTGNGLFGTTDKTSNPPPDNWEPPPTLYLSATFAKRPDNMPLYIHTNLRYAADHPDELKELFGKGAGRDVLQQVASEMLVESGSMIRRERSYDGVKMDFITKDDPRDAREVNAVTTVLRSLVNADRALADWLDDPSSSGDVIRQLTAQFPGAALGPKGTAFDALQNTPFTSTVHNYVGQLLVATKVNAAVDLVVDRMNAGEKVVVGLQNTMEAVLNDYVKANDVKEGGELTELGWQTVLRRGVTSSVTITLKSATGNKADDKKIQIPFAMMPPSVRAGYDNVDKLIENFQSQLPVSPIDALRSQLQQKFVWEDNGVTKVGDAVPAGMQGRPLVVKEISGRSFGVNYDTAVPTYVALNDDDRVATINGFQNGNEAQGGPVDVVVVTSAGATGISLHASTEAYDQRPRHMIVLQPHADISVFKQLLGRIHRTGQVWWPSFTMLATGIPAERRVLAMIKKKLSSLVSNTSAGSSTTAIEGVDFVNQYGDVAVARYLNAHAETRVFMGYDEFEDEEDAAGTDIAMKASGRAGILPVADQQDFFDSVEADYEADIAYRNATGTNALTRTVYPYDAELLESTQLDAGLGQDNPFTRATSMDRYSVLVVGEVPSAHRVEEALKISLNGRTADEVIDQIESDLNLIYVVAHDQLVGRQQALQAEAAAPTATEKDRELLAKRLEAIQKEIDKFSERRETTLRRLRNDYPIGSGYAQFEESGVPASAVIVGYKVHKSKSTSGNPYSPSNFEIQFRRNIPGPNLPASLAKLEGRTIVQNNHYGSPPIQNWFQLKAAVGGREKKYVATGNVLRAKNLLPVAGGEIANFTLANGTTKLGMVMPASYQPGNLASLPYTIRTPAAAAQVALSSWAALLTQKVAATQMQEYEDLLKAVQAASFATDMPDPAVLDAAYGRVMTGKRDGWLLRLDTYTPSDGFTLSVNAKNKALVKSQALEQILGGPLTRRKRTVSEFTSSSTINDPDQVVKLVKLLHRSESATVKPELADFAKAIVKADFGITEGKTKSGTGQASRAGAPADYGQTVAEVQAQLVPLAGITVNVVQSVDELPVEGAPGDMEGVWYSGTTVYLIADNLPNARRVQQVLSHEAIGHAAMEAMLGPKLMAELLKNVQNLEKTGHRLVREVAAHVDATQPGLTGERRAKEIIGVMAERGEHVKGSLWQRIVQAVRVWLRDQGFNIKFSELDVLAALRDAEKFARRPAGTVAESTEVANPFSALQPQYSIASDLSARVAGLLHSDEQFNWWHRSVGTQQHKAYVNPAFGRVFDEGQRFLTAISKFANDAADMAQSLLPRIEKWGDFGKKAPTKDDVKAVMDATMAGTLFGGGSPLSGRRWNDRELASGQADNAMPGAPQVFTPLTPEQIALYKEGQDAIAVALDNFTKGVIHRLVNRHGIAFDPEMSLEDGAELVRNQLQDKADEQELRARNLRTLIPGLDPNNISDAARIDLILRDITQAQQQQKVYEDIAKEVTVVEDKAASLKAHGYFPAMRFGQFAVYITRTNPRTGEVTQTYFGLFESQTSANVAAMRLAKQYPENQGYTLTRGSVSTQQSKLFEGLSLDSLEHFADHIVDNNGNAISKDPLVQGFLKAAIAERSAMKRQIHRKGISGYSEDMPRVLASYIVSTARSAGTAFHMGNMVKYADSIPEGFEKDEAIKLVDYLRNPVEEAQKTRSFLFTQFLGGSIAHGLINITSPAMLTVPYLSQFTTATDASLKVAAAAKQNADALTGDARDAYLRAKKEGVVAPQEMHQLRAETGGAVLGGGLFWRKMSFVWGSIYSVSEQFNRTTTFLAAFEVAMNFPRLNAPGVSRAERLEQVYAFAANAVNETQFIYNKGNRPDWARGAVGATVFTFKQWGISYVELAKRMYDLKHPDGKRNLKPFAFLLLMLLLAGGLEGLPFAEDAEDILDTVGQWMGFNTNVKKSLHNFIARELGMGETMARVMRRGLSGFAFSWMPIDVSLRFSLGNLIPGTGLLKPSEKNKMKELLEVAGPIGQFVPVEGTLAGKALEKLRKGEYGEAALQVSPVAVRNVGIGTKMLYTGQYPDPRHRQGIEVTTGEAIAKMIGFQPARVAEDSERQQRIYRDISLQAVTESDIAEAWAVALAEGDVAGQQRAMDRMTEWNRNNPDMPVHITAKQLRNRARQMMMPRDDRIIRGAPRELRGQVYDELQRGQPAP